MTRALMSNVREFVSLVKGTNEEFNLRPYRAAVHEIESRGEALIGATDKQLRELSMEMAIRAQGGESLDDLLPQAFALVREACHRVLGLRAFDVQILGALALYRGKIAEMATGEGKTLTAVFPSYLHALAKRGVHVLTVNDYLAQRDAKWMGAVHEFLGLEVGFVQEGMDRNERRKAYQSDITYVTAKQAGFDFLRDSLCTRLGDQVHRPFHVALIDEVDSILIDEARIPLIIAGLNEATSKSLTELFDLVRGLEQNVDFVIGENARNIRFTDRGFDRLEETLGCGPLHDPDNLSLFASLNNALHAERLLHRDVDYIVRDSSIELIDEFTGRVAENRRWPDGLQAALEAKEGLRTGREGDVLGSITIENFIRLYPKIGGMSGTARSSAKELWELYDLPVVVVPPHRPCQRVDHPDVVFTNRAAKERAILEEIKLVHTTMRPILVGTCSIEESERLACLLSEAGIRCEVLNAKNDEQEAQIIANAGSLGAVTISTNMAGRGTDIRLGGPREEERERVAELGGLYVIGTNRHDSVRIDDQLRGRSGRQGDPGSSRFYVSLEDPLMTRFGVEQFIPSHRLSKTSSEAIEDHAVRREILRAQRIVDSANFDIRKTLRRYSAIVDQERAVLHGRRQEILEGNGEMTLLASRGGDRYRELLERLGEGVLATVERQLTLHFIDRYWAQYLAFIAHTREGIYLASATNTCPLDTFHKLAVDAFNALGERIDEAVVEAFAVAEINKSGVDMQKSGLEAPSATWTYLVDDNPFGSPLDRIASGLVDTFREMVTKVLSCIAPKR